MGKILILPDILCNQIAAGEVVERPSAVVKELVENSIDAGSSKVSVLVLHGGRKEIRVVDNGCGMHADDALLALERHATSKIRTVDDLQAISSLGFRGEALPSIAAVSRFELATREKDAVSGAHIFVEGGVIKDVREKGCPPGTMVLVRDLFYNVPARRKFMRTEQTELAHLCDQFLRLAMANPEVHFQLAHGEKTLYDFPKTKGAGHRAFQVLGRDLAQGLISFSRDLGELSVSGLVSPPGIFRTNTQSLFFFVNGRPVYDRLLQRAVVSVYESLIPRGKYPAAALYLLIPPGQVDVNVHPTKREVRFRNPGEIVGFIREAFRDALSGGKKAPSIESLAAPSPFARDFRGAPPSQVFLRETQSGFHARASVRPEPNPAPFGQQPSSAPIFGSMDFSDPGASPGRFSVSPADRGPIAQSMRPAFSALPVVGQIADAYILLEAEDGLILVDQHAAHERIVYNRLASGRLTRSAQRLTRPAVLDLLPKEARVLTRWLSEIGALGFEIEPFGGSSFVIHAVPSALTYCSPEALVRDFLAGAEEEAFEPRSDILSRFAKTAACHASVRAGQKLAKEEIAHLLKMLDSEDLWATCPHGRPVWQKLTLPEIAKLFLRS